MQQSNSQPWLNADVYNAAKARHPNSGRRKWQMAALQEFWKLHEPDKDVAHLTNGSLGTLSDASSDRDPLDDITELEQETLGILVRTDFSDEEAWTSFRSKLKDADEDLRQCLVQTGEEEEDGDVEMGDSNVENDGNDDEDEDDDEDDSSPSVSIIHVLDPPPGSALRNALSGISNLTALRLLNNVHLRPAPEPPKDTTRDSRQNPLIDRAGLQEVYVGKGLWVYDKKSNEDMSVRVVSGKSGDGVYGSATADSWRARVGHIYELQYNMRMAGMKIDFGGMDKWDYPERVRNLAEAAV